MLFFIILLIVCLPALLLSFFPEKQHQAQEQKVMAELLYQINEEEEHKKCKWLARFFVNDEPCYILVDCSTAHKQYDFVEVLFAGEYYEYLLYSEPPKSEN